jgi:hypothetical protein
MTPRANRVVEFAVQTLVTLIAGTLLVLFSGAWSLKEDAADHRNDITLINGKLDRILDAICDPAKEKPRTCSDPMRAP